MVLSWSYKKDSCCTNSSSVPFSRVTRQFQFFQNIKNFKMNCLLKTTKVEGEQFPHLDHRPESIASASLNQSHETIMVTFTDGSTYEYPWLFLQHNCTCSTCYHPSSHSTLRQITELDSDNQICSVKVLPDRSGVNCRWMNGHEAVFSDNWLKIRRFTEDNKGVRSMVPRDFPQFTGPKDILGRVDFGELLIDELKLLQMLETLSVMGVCILENTPRKVGQIRMLAEKIGFIRVTHYGHEFTVKSAPNPINLAYTSKRLGFHTDLPYYSSPPGVQMLHCIKQFDTGKGGETHLVDGFRVAEQMKKHHPDEFKILRDTPLEFCDIGKDYTSFFKVYKTPLFVCDPDTGALIRIAYSSHVLSSFLPLNLHEVKPMYEALKLFMKLCYSEENLIEFKLKPGEVMVFDNWRMLHGREGFDPSKGERHLEGCYVDWDEVNCRIRVIRKNLGMISL